MYIYIYMYTYPYIYIYIYIHACILYVHVYRYIYIYITCTLYSMDAAHVAKSWVTWISLPHARSAGWEQIANGILEGTAVGDAMILTYFDYRWEGLFRYRKVYSCRLAFLNRDCSLVRRIFSHVCVCSNTGRKELQGVLRPPDSEGEKRWPQMDGAGPQLIKFCETLHTFMDMVKTCQNHHTPIARPNKDQHFSAGLFIYIYMRWKHENSPYVTRRWLCCHVLLKLKEWSLHLVASWWLVRRREPSKNAWKRKCHGQT